VDAIEYNLKLIKQANDLLDEIENILNNIKAIN